MRCGKWRVGVDSVGPLRMNLGLFRSTVQRTSPAIDLLRNPGVSKESLVRLATLWRKANLKTLHIQMSGETPMLLIVVRTGDNSGNVANTAIAGTVEDIESGRRQLDKMINDFNEADPRVGEAAGYDGKQDYWWVRANGLEHRYTIEALAPAR